MSCHVSFLENNNLQLIIRSHECVMEGYTRWGSRVTCHVSRVSLWSRRCHEESVVTVFSAPNYCDTTGNLGAVAILPGSAVLRPHFRVFDTAPDLYL